MERPVPSWIHSSCARNQALAPPVHKSVPSRWRLCSGWGTSVEEQMRITTNNISRSKSTVIYTVTPPLPRTNQPRRHARGNGARVRRPVAAGMSGCCRGTSPCRRQGTGARNLRGPASALGTGLAPGAATGVGQLGREHRGGEEDVTARVGFRV